MFAADYRKTDAFKIKPVPLNKGEAFFVDDLRTVINRRLNWLEGWSIHLLRNQVRRGVRFFEANNFYPDFLVWLTRGTVQRLLFVDPKGIRNLKSFSDEKIQLAFLIKKRERDLRARGQPQDVDVHLHSFIVANTSEEAVEWWTESAGELPTLDVFAANNVVFQEDERSNQKYIERMLRRVLGLDASTSTRS